MRFLLIVIFSIAFSFPMVSFAFAANNLTPEQSAFVEKIEKFHADMEKRVFDAIGKLNGAGNIEEKKFEYDTSDYVVKVIRGAVVEKGGVMSVVIKKEMPKVRIPEPLAARYLQIDIYPKTPLVGMLHIAVNFGYYKDGSNNVSGTMDVTPGTIIEEDLNYIKGELDKLFEKHGQDISSYRKPLEHGKHKDKLKGSCVGVSFYRFPEPGLPPVTEENFKLVTESAQTLFDAYMKVIEKRKDDKFTEVDVSAMFDMRKRWLEKEFFWDMFPSTGTVPYEVWSMQDLPPEVRF